VPVERSALIGSWIRSGEEDGPEERVYRRPGYPFPPARGRESFELAEDGRLVERGPGPTDIPTEDSGEWELEDDSLRLRSPAGERALEIVSAESDRLVVRA